MSTASTNMTSLLPAGVERTLEHIDIRHDYFPVPLYLSTELFMNTVRHNSSSVLFKFEEQPNGDFHVSARNNGDGNADPKRIIAPAEENGLGTSRYAHGMRMTRLKSAGRDEPWCAKWKKSGETFYRSISNSSRNGEPDVHSLGSANGWNTSDEQGFEFNYTLKAEKLGDCKPFMIAHQIREICEARMTPATLASLHIRVEVIDKEGNPYKEELPPPKLKKNGEPRKQKREARITGIVDSREENWKSILDVLDENRVGNYPIATQIISSHATAVAKFYRLIPKKKEQCVHPHMPIYTSKKAQYALIVQDGFITEVPLPVALDRAPHASSMNGRFVVISVERPIESIVVEDSLDANEALRRKERIRQDSILSPASSKMTYHGPLYEETLKFVRDQKPRNWDTFIKEGDDVSDTQSVGSSDGSESVKPKKALTKLAKSIGSIEGQQTFPDDLRGFSITTTPVAEPPPAVVDVPTAEPLPVAPEPVMPQSSRQALIAQGQALLRAFLDHAKLLTPEEFPIGTDGLEDWVENGPTTYDV